MSRSLQELIGELNRLSSWDASGGLAEVALRLEQRQELLTRIQKADASMLDPATRVELSRQLAEVRARDARLLAILENEREKLEKSLSEVVHARDAVRGYRSVMPEPEARKTARVA